MRYLLVNKPFEVLPQFTDEAGRATLKQFVEVPEVYPVGRLDYDSEGLMLLTDDKHMQFRLAEPRYKVPKTYWVQVEGEPTEEALEQLRRGVQIKDGFTSPAEVKLLPEPPAGLWERSKPVRFRAAIPTSWIELTISEGMNRQVRKMTAVVGFPTLRLVRAGIASLTVEGLAPGQWRELKSAEVQELKSLTAAALPGEVPARKKPTVKYDPNYEQKVAAERAARARRASERAASGRGPKSGGRSGGRSSAAGGRSAGPASPTGTAPRGGKTGGPAAPRTGGKTGGAGPARPASPGRSSSSTPRPPRRSK